MNCLQGFRTRFDQLKFWNRRAVIDDQDEPSSRTTSFSEKFEMEATFPVHEVVHSNCPTMAQALELISSYSDSTDDSVLLLNIHMERNFHLLSKLRLRELAEKFSNKSILVFLQSQDNDKFLIIWKSYKYDYFYQFRHYSETYSKDDLRVYRFIVDYLVESLSHGRLGIDSDWPDGELYAVIDCPFFYDCRGFTLLLMAVECGDIELVKFFIREKVSYEPGDPEGDTAQEMAYKSGQYEMLLQMILLNLPYPPEMDLSILPAEFHVINQKAEELHAAVMSGDIKQVEQVLLSSPFKLRHYFNLDNESASKKALEMRFYDIYELLIVHNVFFALHEDHRVVYGCLPFEDKVLLREMHFKHRKQLPDKHLKLLYYKSTAMFDPQDPKKDMNSVNDVYQIMSQHPMFDWSLKAIAAHSKYEFIYDFCSDEILYEEPKFFKYKMNPKVRIRIGVKQLLDEDTKHLAMARIAKVIFRFALDLVFKNQGRPYAKNDNLSMQQFEEINAVYKKFAHQEPAIKEIYKEGSLDEEHAELATTVPYLMLLYHNQPKLLEDLRTRYVDLFEYLEGTIPQLEAAVPELENTEKVQVQQTEALLKKLKFYYILSMALLIPAVIGFLFFSYWLFTIWSTPPDLYVDLSKEHNWTNLNQPLRDKLLNSNLNFQNETLKFSDLVSNGSDSYNTLTSPQLIKILTGQTFVVGTQIKNEVNFYIERETKFLNGTYKNSELIDPIIVKYPSESEIVRELRNKNFIGNDTNFFIEKPPEIPDLFRIYIFEDFSVIPKDSKKIHVLSAEAGAGKTVFFEQLSLKIKHKFPKFWVSYIDLKDFVQFYNSSGILEDPMGLLRNVIKPQSEFEWKVFEKLFWEDKVVLLWNGFDEISPTYSQFVIKVLNFINSQTSNDQFVCTRPLYEAMLRKSLNSKIFTFKAYTEDDRSKFLHKYFQFQNISQENIEHYTEKVLQVAKRLDFDTPLMLILIAEIHDEVDLLGSLNLYSIYDKFLDKKIQIWQKKSIYADKITNLLLTGVTLDVRQIYHKYAILHLLSKRDDSKNLRVMNVTIPEQIPSSEISRMGILFFDHQKKFTFAHRTFAEFFLSQYFLDQTLGNDEQFEEFILKEKYAIVRNEMVREFLHNYFDNEKNARKRKLNNEMTTLLRTKYDKILFKLGFVLFDVYSKLLSKDHELYVQLLHIYEDDTPFLEDLNVLHSGQTYAALKNLSRMEIIVKRYLSEEEMLGFMYGRDLKGVVWYLCEMLNLRGYKDFPTFFPISANVSKEFLENYYEIIHKNLTEPEQRRLLSYLLKNEITKYEDDIRTRMLTEAELIGMIVLAEKNNFRKILDELTSSAKYTEIFSSPDLKKFTKLFISKTNLIFYGTEVFKFLTTTDVFLKESAFNFQPQNFELFWIFSKSFFSKAQHKEILLKDYESELGVHFKLKLPSFVSTSIILYPLCSNKSGYLCYKILFEVFTLTEIQDLVLQRPQFLPLMVDEESTFMFSEFLAKVFVGRELELFNYLDSKFGDKNETVYDLYLDKNHEKSISHLVRLKGSLGNESVPVQVNKANQNITAYMEKFKESYKIFHEDDVLFLIDEIRREAERNGSVNSFRILQDFETKRNISSDLRQVLQKLAVLERFEGNPAVTQLGIAKASLPTQAQLEELTQLGVTSANQDNQHRFKYSSLASFYAVQFLIDNSYLLPQDEHFEEAVLDLIVDSSGDKLLRLAEDYLDLIESENRTRTLNPELVKCLRTNHSNILFDVWFKRPDLYDKSFFAKFKILTTIISKERNLLVDLLHLNNSESFYTREHLNLYNLEYAFLSQHLEATVKPFLTDDELDKFLYGKNGKGKVWYVEVWLKFNGYPEVRLHADPDVEFVNDVYLEDFYEKFQQNLTSSEQKELLMFSLANPLINRRGVVFPPDHFQKLWSHAENMFNKQTVIKVLLNLVQNGVRLNKRTIDEYPHYFDLIARKILTKLSVPFVESEVAEISLALCAAVYESSFGYYEFKVLNPIWEIFRNLTSTRQQQLVLRKTVNPLDFKDEFPSKLSNEVQSSVNLLHVASRSARNIESGFKIYDDYFSHSELQTVLVESSIISSFLHNTVELVERVEPIFEGNEKVLVDFLNIHVNVDGAFQCSKTKTSLECAQIHANKKAFMDFKQRLEEKVQKGSGKKEHDKDKGENSDAQNVLV